MTRLQTSVLKTVTEVNENQWNNVVEQSDLGCLFHRYEWLRALEEGLEMEPHHITIFKGTNPVAIFPNFVSPISVDGLNDLTERLPVKRLVSTKPGAGGPVITTDKVECLDRMFEALSEGTDTGVLFHSVRTIQPGYAKYGKRFIREGYEASVVNCRLMLGVTESWGEILDGMHKSRRQAIKRTEKSGIEVHSPPLSRETLRETYEMYAANMARIGGKTFPFSFFERLFDQLTDRIQVFVAERDSKEVGRYLHLLDNQRSVVNYFFAGIPTEEALKSNPSEALHAAAIKWAKNNGYHYYDFGGTAADFTEGVFRFKHRFGADVVPAVTWQKGQSQVGWPAFKAARSLYRHVRY